MRCAILGLVAAAVVAVGATLALGRFSYAPLPAEGSLLNPLRLPPEAAFDVMGRAVSSAEAEVLRSTEAGRALLSPAGHAVQVDAALVASGRDAFYRETYGNEVFLTDIMGLIDGGFSVTNVSLALAALAGRGTNDLRVRIARDVIVGDRVYKRGEVISTGLDVPRGGVFPLGIRVFYDRGRVRMGIACALCHSAVEPGSGKVVEGAPNIDLNVGLMMALASNPAAYFMHTGVTTLAPYQTRPDRVIATGEGRRERLPEPGALAADVRRMLAAWPPGNFDSSPDLVNNPTSIPSSFTLRGEPYGWSGHAGIGPFRGLSALNNNVHGLNSDTTAQYLAAPVLFGLDPELYLGTLLQDAPAARHFRFDPGGARKPSDVLAAADPTPGTPGVNHYAVLPTYPRANYVTSNSLIATRPGEPVERSIDAMSAFQNTLRPPDATAGGEGVAPGKDIFRRAGCVGCHSGPALTNNRVLPVDEIGTEPTRARSFARTEATIAPPQLFAADAGLPPGPRAALVDVPVPDEAQLKLAWAHGGSAGGYKVPNLVGLAWSAPYLHDGGVAVAADPSRRGVDATLLAGIPADPAHSLRALVDRDLRAAVVAANRASPGAALAHVTGGGHAYWADRAAGFSETERDALVAYLLSIDRPDITTSP